MMQTAELLCLIIGLLLVACGAIPHLPLMNHTIAGTDIGCKHTATYVTNAVVSFPMCIGQTDQDLKNGMSIINVITSRGYLPTCRVMQLMLWMASEVSGHRLHRDTFVDVGANIGSCSVHMASLGFPVISVEPVLEHVNTIRGSVSVNPSFNIEVQHIGLAIENKTIHANFGHGARNWGATEFHEVAKDQSFELELKLKTFEQVLGHRHVSLVKIDCEGCEWAAIKSARKALRRIPMLKIELVQPSYEAGNETVTSKDVLKYLQEHGFHIYMDMWEEQSLYFGRRPNDILDIDRIFGSKKFQLQTDETLLHSFANKVLQNPIDYTTFDRNQFLKKATDVIVIEASLSERMKKRWLA